jgi:FSR family fosmidomycin resistance protein-like MFS transporter
VEVAAPASPPETTPPVELKADRRRYATLVASHLVVDLYPIFIVALAVSLQSNLGLTNAQRATVIALGPIVAGLCQPLFAWIGDRFDTRFFGPAGLAVGAVAISCIGFAETFPQLLALQTIGLIGTGVYHPIGAAVAGRLGARALRGVRFVHSPRASALSIFFLAGMLGGFFGPIISTRLNEATGDMRWLAVMAAPGLLLAWALWVSTRKVAHREVPKFVREDHPDAARRLRKRRFHVGVLFTSNALRYTANVGCYFLFTAWAKQHFADDAVASSRAGDLIAATTLGMSAGALLASRVRQGAERRDLILTGLLAAPLVAVIPFLPVWGMMACACLAAALYFTGIPASIGLAHRLLPHATGMTGALLMGIGWVVAASGPIVGEHIVSLGPSGLEWAFIAMAAALAASGLVNLLLDRDLIDTVADRD